MAEDTPPVDEMHYEALAQDALRGVIRSALERAASPSGIPGEHHFYITFKTRGRGVSVPPDVLAKYPDEMTIVLQHQYWDLAVEHDLFSVMLKFGGMPKVLTVPYNAVTRFYDPSVQFLLQFEAPETVAEPVAIMTPEPTRPATVPPEGDDSGPKVVSLDQFRKK
ncbi:SspB family protein [Brevundimonas goettingensis]|uniref:Stringent starvation protein B n=1 Tax=Brevundimonas goettingensis TaxID=2774190 RepID=A0A975C2K0_9CAUL|nr:ClpXP protease specificity-enhancing factor SspB [Brevundimonas goettingensis]QTC92671.1 stringent starvation protein B [Brevundimonas goettingensis]